MWDFILAFQFLLLCFPHSGFSKPTVNSWTLPGNNSYPEGIARQEGSPYFYTGSFTTGTIWRGNVNSGEVSVYIPSPNTFNLTAAAGIKVVGDNLVIAGASTGTVFFFDLKTGSLVHRFKSVIPGALVNDLAIAENGNIYITDSFTPHIYIITPQNIANPTIDQELVLFAELTPPFEQVEGKFNANGLVITGDQNYLLIGDYNSHAIFRLTLKSKEIIKVDFGGVQIGSPDGMLRCGDIVYYVNGDNTLSPRPFIDVLEIKKPYLKGTSLRRIENDLLVLPATAAFDGKNHLLVTNFQINAAVPELPFTIARIPIGN